MPAGATHFYYQEKTNGSLVPCHFGNRNPTSSTVGDSHECEDEKGLDLNLSRLDIWAIHYNNETRALNFFMVYDDTSKKTETESKDKKEEEPAKKKRVFSQITGIEKQENIIAIKCAMDKPIMTPENLNCGDSTITVTVPEYLKGAGFSLRYKIKQDLDEFIATYHDINDNVYSSLEGYLWVNFDNRVSRFTDLGEYKASFMNPLSITDYILQRGTFMYLVHRRDEFFNISPPKFVGSDTISLSVYDTYDISTFENDKINEAKISRVDDHFTTMELLPIKAVTFYNQGWNAIGYNAKLILGNNPSYQVKLDGNNLPSKTRFINPVSIIMENLDDINIDFLDINRDGSIFVISDTEDVTLKIF